MQEDLSIYRYYNEQLEYHERYTRHNFLAQRLLNIIIQANWNKRILCNPYFQMMNNDLEIHKNRFGRYMAIVDTIATEMQQLRINYNAKRINKIQTILTKIQNYEN
jgi:hypothetical protein